MIKGFRDLVFLIEISIEEYSEILDFFYLKFPTVGFLNQVWLFSPQE